MAEVVIATATLYKLMSDSRVDLATRTVEEAAQEGIPLVVLDSGSPREFHDTLRRLGAHVILEGTGTMGANRRTAMAAAQELAGQGGTVVWMEPEKWPLIADIGRMVRPIIAAEADFVVPARTAAGLATYPPEQELAEQLGNLAVHYLIGKEFDFWFGPIAMNQEALRHMLEYKDEYGGKWDAIHIPRLRMLAGGLVGMSVDVGYRHPGQQTREETGNIGFLIKRIEQLLNLIPSLHQEAKKLGLTE